MKKTSYILALLLSAQFLSAVTITNFGSGSWTTQTFGNDFTAGAQDASSLAITGNAANRLAGIISTVDISGSSASLTIGGTFSSGSGAFSIQLFDSGFNVVEFTGGSFADLVNSGSSTLSFSSNGGANLADIFAVDIIGAGAPSTAVAGTFNSLVTPVPEPSAYAALAGICALGWVAVRRRRA